MTYNVFGFDLDPVLIPSIENIFRVRMLDNKSLAAIAHNLVQAVLNVHDGLALEFGSEFQSTFALLDICP